MIQVLDCTLRDGGYVNDFNFGKKNIKKITANLTLAGVDIIECGWLVSGKNNQAKSQYGDARMVSSYLPKDHGRSMYVAMVAYGDIQIDEICDKSETDLDGIRVTFHEHQVDDAIEFSKALMKKGYKVFFQPVGTISYTDKALLELIEKVNKMSPFAFYLVDTLGSMYKNNLLRMFYLVDNNLSRNIKIGFHSHNNLQLSFSNAQELILMPTKRDIIIDSSVFGMGRGAGNLCTELILQYINENIKDRYEMLPILEIIDECIMSIYTKYPWGYSVPYYIAAVRGCHPNYAMYLMGMQKLCIRDINVILNNIPAEKRHLFDKKLIAELYIDYQKNNIDDTQALAEISEWCKDRNVLLIAPGKSLLSYKKEINNYINKNKPFIISINHIPNEFPYDRIFLANLRRFKDINEALDRVSGKLICTSHIANEINCCVVNYGNYLNNNEVIADNAGLMLINILKKAGVRKFALAGYDGFVRSHIDNFFDAEMADCLNFEREEAINDATIDYFDNLKKSVEVEFITPTIYDKGKTI